MVVLYARCERLNNNCWLAGIFVLLWYRCRTHSSPAPQSSIHIPTLLLYTPERQQHWFNRSLDNLSLPFFKYFLVISTECLQVTFIIIISGEWRHHNIQVAVSLRGNFQENGNIPPTFRKKFYLKLIKLTSAPPPLFSGVELARKD